MRVMRKLLARCLHWCDDNQCTIVVIATPTALCLSFMLVAHLENAFERLPRMFPLEESQAVRLYTAIGAAQSIRWH